VEYGAHSASEVEALVASLKQQQIATIFVYVSYLKPTGEFNPTYNHAREFMSAFKQTAPEIEVQAWLGVPVRVPPGTPGESGYVDLADETVQNKIAEFGRMAVQDFGFDGVHLDAEPVVTGDPALLGVLDKIRAVIGSQARLSIAGREITPLLPEADLVINRWFTWRGDYYREVAKRVDQIAVMAYDSHAPFKFWYEQWVRHQVINLTNSLRETTAEILIGIPTSEEHSSSHDPAIENMQTGLAGLLAGLNDLDTQPGKITGAAIYPYWDTTADEWQTYAELWLGQTE
jgi:spore germination protein YaaH